MRNNYKINENIFGGIPFFEIWGQEFNYEDLYELIGKNQFMSTFNFMPEADAFKNYGESITGVMFLSKEESTAIEERIKSVNISTVEKIKIDSPMPDLNRVQREELKYGGIKINEIALLTFHFYKKPIEYYESGEKKIPNIITIPFEDDGQTDYDKLYQSYITMRINSKSEIIPYEKEKFIGMTLAINNGRIDSRLLSFLGFDNEKVQSNNNLWYHYHKTKERRKTITEEEKKKLDDLTYIRSAENIILLFKEINKSGVHSKELSANIEALETIKASLKDFEPHILRHGKRPIYWDASAYIHVVLRHIKKIQLGNFKTKSPFPYRLEDLESLVEKVLGRVDDEIKRHFEECPGKEFRRSGKMSIQFNGDYYCLQIDQHGKLVTIYSKG